MGRSSLLMDRLKSTVKAATQRTFKSALQSSGLPVIRTSSRHFDHRRSFPLVLSLLIPFGRAERCPSNWDQREIQELFDMRHDYSGLWSMRQHLMDFSNQPKEALSERLRATCGGEGGTPLQPSSSPPPPPPPPPPRAPFDEQPPPLRFRSPVRSSPALEEHRVILAGDVTDTLGSAIYGVQSFMALALAFRSHLIQKGVADIHVGIEPPGMPGHVSVRTFLPTIPFSAIFNVTTLKERLTGVHVVNVENNPMNRTTCDLCIHRDYDLGAKTSQALVSLFERMEILVRNSTRRDLRVFVRFSGYGEASCVAGAMHELALRGINALDLNDRITKHPRFNRSWSCGYAYLRRGISVQERLKHFTGLGTAPMVNANSKSVNMDIKTYSHAIRELMQKLGGRSASSSSPPCLAMNYPPGTIQNNWQVDKGPKLIPVATSAIKLVEDELKLAKVGVNGGGIQVFNSESEDIIHFADSLAELPEHKKMMLNVIELENAVAAPLFISEGGTLWADYVLMKRAMLNRPSAVFLPTASELPRRSLRGPHTPKREFSRSKVKVQFRVVVCRSNENADSAALLEPFPGIAFEVADCRASCYFVRGVCLNKSQIPYPDSNHKCFSN